MVVKIYMKKKFFSADNKVGVRTDRLKLRRYRFRFFLTFKSTVSKIINHPNYKLID